MQSAATLIRKFWQEESGQDILEYAFILCTIALIVVVSMNPPARH